MFNSKFSLSDIPKKFQPAASNFESTTSEKPPALKLEKQTQSSDQTNTSSASPQNLQSTSSSSKPSVDGSKMMKRSLEQTETNGDNSEHEEENDHESPTDHLCTINPAKFLSAVISGHEIFKQTARFNNVKINGGIASGPPGCLQGSDIKPFIKSDSKLVGHQGANKHMVDAVTKVVGDNFNLWQNTLMIPNLMLYPMFNFIPGPMAPPMPNIPTQLTKLVSPFQNHLTNPSLIAQQIVGHLPSEMQNGMNANMIEQIATMVASYFEQWFQFQYITDVLGTGPVPHFHPPFSFGGPVQNGHTLPIPTPFK